MSRLAYLFSYESTFSYINETIVPDLQSLLQADGAGSWSCKDLENLRLVLRRLATLRVKNSEDAEDLVQETLLTVTTKRPAGDLEKGLLVWGMGVLRKKLGNYYRKNRRILEAQKLGIDIAQLAWISAGPDSPEAKMFQSELHTLIDKTLEKFPTQEQRALRLMLAGLPAREIASMMAPESYQNVLNHLFRGRKKLARQLIRHGWVPHRRESRSREPEAGSVDSKPV